MAPLLSAPLALTGGYGSLRGGVCGIEPPGAGASATSLSGICTYMPA